MDKKIFQTGLNLGGWISQYPAYDYGHFDTFIKADDIRRIADWGCDHIRLPVDYPLLELEDRPGKVNDRGMEYVWRGLRWCRENGLNVILDLHKAPGFSFNAYQDATLFDDAAQQERYLQLWETVARSLQGTRDYVAFELLNEIVLPDSAPWNRLAQKTIDLLQQVDPQRLLVVGGNYYNSASQLVNLNIRRDANILYTFHFYEPMVITHQKAKWIPGMVDYNEQTDYPGTAPHLGEFLQRHPEYKLMLGRYLGKNFDKTSLLADVQPAVDFTKANDTVVYCGEFGVIEAAPMQTRINWARDLISILKAHGIGRAYWSYKGVDFGLIDPSGNVISEELIRTVCAH